jgi:hypothetical protein
VVYSTQYDYSGKLVLHRQILKDATPFLAAAFGDTSKDSPAEKNERDQNRIETQI